MNKILGVNNENDISTLLLKKNYQPQITYLTVTKPSDILYTGHLNEHISHHTFTLSQRIFSIKS